MNTTWKMVSGSANAFPSPSSPLTIQFIASAFGLLASIEVCMALMRAVSASFRRLFLNSPMGRVDSSETRVLIGQVLAQG